MKKLLSYVLALLMLVQPMLGTTARAAEIVDSGTCGGNLTWTLDNEGTLTISGTGEMWNYEINHTPWNAYFTTVTSLVIEKGVTSISDFAFTGCYFRSIEIPEGLIRIGTCAFSLCYYVEDIYIPASVLDIGEDAFLECGAFPEIGLRGIWVDTDNPNYSSDQYGVLFDKHKTTIIQAPNSISGNYQIPKSVVSIIECAFFGCRNLTSVEIPEGVTTIGGDTFYGCYDLTSIHIPKSVTRIDGAFSNCNSLTDVYYGGTKAQWDAISIKEQGNEDLLNANIHYTTPTVSGNPFADVAADAYYFKPVQWAVKNSITNGMDATHFAPDGTCTRAQIVTFLWRANGSPKPSATNNPFTDVPAGQWYTDAVLWAVEKGITTGTSATTFSPDAGCTRGQVATFLWRSQTMPASVMPVNSFTDINPNAYYYNAVLWAVENGITNGLSATAFGPDATCTRGQIVTFLYRNDSVQQHINRYTFHAGDVTWSEANEKAKELGGHLVHLNSIGEMGYLMARIYEMDYEASNYILLGGRRDLDEVEYYWADTDGSKVGGSLNEKSSWENALWLMGEPSLGYAGGWEDVMAMQYSDKDGRWGWNDVPDDLPNTILKNDPSKLGTIVYIVEYDD